MAEVRVEAWRVHDTGLVAVPSRFRRLGGLVRHHQGQGDAWPEAVTLTATGNEFRVTGPAGEALGRWPRTGVTITKVADGPPVSFVVEIPGGAHLLTAAASAATDALLAALA